MVMNPMHDLSHNVKTEIANTDDAKVIKIKATNVNVFYSEKQALNNVSVDIEDRSVTAFIGPSGCGKSTFLRCFNRMNDVIPNCRVDGSIIMGDMNINSQQVDPVLLRARIGMVFKNQIPSPRRSLKMWLMDRAFTGLHIAKASLMTWLRIV